MKSLVSKYKDKPVLVGVPWYTAKDSTHWDWLDVTCLLLCMPRGLRLLGVF